MTDEKTFTKDEVDEWAARLSVGHSLINIYERFGSDFTPMERVSTVAAIQFFIPGWHDGEEPPKKEELIE